MMRSSLATLVVAAILLLTPNLTLADVTAEEWFQGKKRNVVPNPPFTPSYDTYDGPRFENLNKALNEGITVNGRARIDGDNVQGARVEATNKATTFAMEILLNNLLDQEVTRNQRRLVRNVFLDQHMDYLASIREISATTEEDVLEVTLEVNFEAEEILETCLERRMQLASQHLPRVALVVPVKPVNGEFPEELLKVENSLETTLRESLMDANIRVLDRRELFRALKDEGRAALLFGEDEEAAEAGRRAGADILVRGSTVVTAGAAPNYLESSGMAVIQSAMTLHAIRTADGAPVTTVEREGSAVHITVETGSVRAIKDGLDQVDDEFIAQLIRGWLLEEASTSTVTLHLNDVPSRSALVDLHARLEDDVNQIRRVARRSYADHTAVMEVFFQGDRARLLTKLEEQGYVTISGEAETEVTATYRSPSGATLAAAEASP